MITYEQYTAERVAFFQKHGEFVRHDSDMKCDHYMKTYSFKDGATWCEECGPVYEKVEVEVRGFKLEASVKLFRVEFWSSEAGSKFYFEKY
jgi:hypothetical protein